MYELLLGLLVFVSVIAIGGAVLSASAARREALRARLGRAEDLPEEEARPAGPGWGLFQNLFGRIGMMVSSEPPSRTLREHLSIAGYHGRSAGAVYLGAKAFLFVAGLVVLAVFLLPIDIPLVIKIPSVFLGATVLFFVPNLVVYLRWKNRREEVRRHLPDAIDLLEICVSSGMGLDMAWILVSDEIRHVAPNLADEMALANLETHLGAPRVEAMRHMAQRTGADELSSLVGVLVQAEKFGTSIADSLRAFAETMRAERRVRAQEAAEKVPVKLLFPMALFFFPALLIVLAGPAAISLLRVMGGE